MDIYYFAVEERNLEDSRNLEEAGKWSVGVGGEVALG